MHCLNASVDGCLPAEGVSAQTMAAAIELAQAMVYWPGEVAVWVVGYGRRGVGASQTFFQFG
ncbi:MAG: hypothetical protein AAF821_26950 [Cyanobacteria bacterium P01_D01_bin.156]